MPTNDIDFNGKTIRDAILAADNTIVGDIAKDSTLAGIDTKVAATNTKQDTIIAQQAALNNLEETLRYFAGILAQLGFTVDPASGRMRISVETGTLPAVTTVSTVTTLSQIGGIAANGAVFDIMQDAWANNIRGRIS